MNKLLLILMAVVLAISIVPLGCAPPADDESYEIEIYSFMMGTSTYAFATAMAQFLYEEDSFVVATVLESPSSAVNSKLLIEDEDMRTTVIGYITPEQARAAIPPLDYDPPYQDLRHIAAFGQPFGGFISTDPSIQEPEDLANKLVAVLSGVPGDPHPEVTALIASGAANLTYAEYSFSGMIQALQDGVVDAASVSGFLLDPVNKVYAPNPALVELLETAEHLSYISPDEGAYQAADDATGRPWIKETVIPAGNFHVTQTVDWRIRGTAIGWGCDAAMPDDVVYEFTKVMAENAHRFASFHATGSAISAEYMPRWSGMNNTAWWHPGALQYYEEAGLIEFLGLPYTD
ncbi:MAG: TAXI family TRAP transporter solute-binding subunit [Dehalococcoidia bacterium]